MVFSIKLSMCISLLDNAIISPLLYNAIVFYIFFNFSILHNLCGVLLCIMHNGVMQQGYVVYIIPGVYFWDWARTLVRFVLSCTSPRPKLLFVFINPKIGKTSPFPQSHYSFSNTPITCDWWIFEPDGSLIIKRLLSPCRFLIIFPSNISNYCTRKISSKTFALFSQCTWRITMTLSSRSFILPLHGMDDLRPANHHPSFLYSSINLYSSS